MLASKDLNSELEAMEQTVAKEGGNLSTFETLQLKGTILQLRLLRDIRSNQVIDLKSRNIELRTSEPGKKTTSGAAQRG